MELLPIPVIFEPDIRLATYDEIDDNFVDIYDYSRGNILVDPIYYANGRNGATNRVFIRKLIADKLLNISANLPNNYKLKIYDAWRSYYTQKDLYDEHYNMVSSAVENLVKSEEELHTITKKFVSYPDKSKKFSFVHSSGGAVDLTIVDGNYNELDMGTKFDEFSSLSSTNAFENSDNDIVKNNRRLLYNAMIDAGFTNYTAEWWHYDYGDIFWSAITGNAAIYSSIYDINDLNIEK